MVTAWIKSQAWNGFSANVSVTILRKLKIKYNIDNLSKINNTTSLTGNMPDESIQSVTCLGKQGKHLVRNLIRKLQRNLTKHVKFIVIYLTKKISYFLPIKDKIQELDKNNLVYQFLALAASKIYRQNIA